MKDKVLFTCSWIVPQYVIDKLSQRFELKISGCQMTLKQRIEEMKGVQGLIMGAESVVTLSMLKADRLLWIIFVGGGYNRYFPKVSLEYMDENKIKLYPAQGGGTSVAQTTVEEIINPYFLRAMAARRGILLNSWAGEDHLWILKQLDVSIVGAGNIGARVLRDLKGLVSTLRYTDQAEKDELRQESYRYEPDLKKTFDADIVSIHLPVIAGSHEQGGTEGIIRLEHLRNLRHGATVINNAREELFNMQEFGKFLTEWPDIFHIWDVLEEKSFKMIGKKTNFFFTHHAASIFDEKRMRQTFKEYGDSILKVVKDHEL